MSCVSVFVEGAEKAPSDIKAQYQQRGVSPDRLRAIRDFAGPRILDVGCGSGAYVLSLSSEFDIHGIDHQEFASWKETPARFRVAAADNLPFDDGAFDTLLSFECVEHLANPAEALREYYRVSRKNLILTVPNCTISEGMKRSNLLYSHWGDPSHAQFFTLPSISAAVEKAGFRVAHAGLINQINPLPFFLEWLGVRNALGLKIASRASKMLPLKAHRLTCLVVGEKP